MIRRFVTPADFSPAAFLTTATLVFNTLIASSVNAATIQRTQSTDGTLDVITIQGPIEDGDAQQFRDAVASSKRAIVFLNSEGGKIMPALDMGTLISAKGFATAVPADALCASACALMWLAGKPRYVSANANIGFHAAYVLDHGKSREIGSANALVGAYLNRIGLSADAIVFVTSAPPEGMEWLTLEEASTVGIVFEVLSDDGQERVKQGKEEFSSDPMATVLAFYRALSSADGESASAFVVPEKRGSGAFNEQNISKFFGNMRQPLQLTELRLMNGELFKVRYRYETSNGQICDGYAEVLTTNQYGRTFIKRIKALNGC